jgi:hypothetical protein
MYVFDPTGSGFDSGMKVLWDLMYYGIDASVK